MKKKILVFALTLCILMVILSGCINSVDKNLGANAKLYGEIDFYSELETFVTKYPRRTSGYVETIDNQRIDYSKEAALYISNELKELGYTTSYKDGLKSFSFSIENSSQSLIGYNVIYKKDNPNTTKKVVIGAHYDNVSDYILTGNEKIGGDGTYNNGAGVAMLLQVAKALADITLDYNVEFVAFGAEEAGNYGAKDYIVNMNANDKDNILLMINFDRVVGGDYVYMYSGEKNYKHNEFMYDKVNENDLMIAPLPHNMKNVILTLDGSDLIYFNQAMLADSNVFGQNNIRYVNFFSMNFSDMSGSTVLESSGKDNISYTKNDNFDYFVARFGGEAKAKEYLNKQASNVYSVIMYALLDENFVSAMESSIITNELMLNGKIISIISYSVLASLIVIILVLYFSLKKGTKSHKVLIDTPYGKMDLETRQIVSNNIDTEKKNVEDIFGLGSSEKDIFGMDSDNNSTVNEKKNENDIFGEF